MQKVAIMTDTTAQLTPEMAQEHAIKLVPFYIILEGKACAENEIDLDWFYVQLPIWKVKGALPTTSSPSAGDFLKAYHASTRPGIEAVLSVSLSSRFGVAFASALQAKRLIAEETPHIPFEVIDSLSTCVGQMFVTLAAARAAARGASLPEVIQATEEMSRKVNYLILSDDLSYLAHGGRTHQASGWVGSKITNSVIMEVDAATGGEHKPLCRYRTRTQAMRRLLEIVAERSGGRALHVSIIHANVPDEAEALKEELASRFLCLDCYLHRAFPIVALHGGLGSLKLGWWHEE